MNHERRIQTERRRRVGGKRAVSRAEFGAVKLFRRFANDYGAGEIAV